MPPHYQARLGLSCACWRTVFFNIKQIIGAESRPLKGPGQASGRRVVTSDSRKITPVGGWVGRIVLKKVGPPHGFTSIFVSLWEGKGRVNYAWSCQEFFSTTLKYFLQQLFLMPKWRLLFLLLYKCSMIMVRNTYFIYHVFLKPRLHQ